MDQTRKSEPTSADGRSHHPLKALCLGLPRTGTTSLAAALSLLGLHNVHQGSTMPWKDFDFFDGAADSSFPNLPTYNGRGGLTREEWGALYAPCEAVIEPAGLFARQLLEVYPEAKVIVTKRPYEIWAASFDQAILRPIFPPFVPVALLQFAQSFLRYKVWSAISKMILGKFGAQDYRGVKARLRDVYDEHHAMLRELVPAENLLEFDVAEGWEPLCRFLEAPVPEAEFPKVNDRHKMREIQKHEVRQNTWTVLIKLTGGGILLTSAGVTAWSLYISRSSAT
jgi:Sulfotransferase domain